MARGATSSSQNQPPFGNSSWDNSRGSLGTDGSGSMPRPGHAHKFSGQSWGSGGSPRAHVQVPDRFTPDDPNRDPDTPNTGVTPAMAEAAAYRRAQAARQQQLQQQQQQQQQQARQKPKPPPIRTGGSDDGATRSSFYVLNKDARTSAYMMDDGDRPPPVPSKDGAKRSVTEPPPQEPRRRRPSLDMLRSVTGFGLDRKSGNTSSTSVDGHSQQPTLRTRRSKDLLRGSLFESSKTRQAEQQRQLGVTSEPEPSRKSSPVVVLKKSSGALRALFRGKPKPEAAPVVRDDSPSESLAKPVPMFSSSTSLSKTPGSPLSYSSKSPSASSFSTANNGGLNTVKSTSSLSKSQTANPKPNSNQQNQTTQQLTKVTSRSSKASNTTPQTLCCGGQQNAEQQQPPRPMQPPPRTDPPPAPPKQSTLSPASAADPPPHSGNKTPIGPRSMPTKTNGSTSSHSHSSHGRRNSDRNSDTPKPNGPRSPPLPSNANKTTPTQPPTRALPDPKKDASLSPSKSFVPLSATTTNSSISPNGNPRELPQNSASPAGSDGGSVATVRGVAEPSARLGDDWSPMKQTNGSTKLNLLQLPELDLALGDFSSSFSSDFSFDSLGFGLSGDSSNSPERGGATPKNGRSSPSRNSWGLQVTPPGGATSRAERRRSKSVGNGEGDSFWRSGFDSSWLTAKQFSTSASSQELHTASQSLPKETEPTATAAAQEQQPATRAMCCGSVDPAAAHAQEQQAAARGLCCGSVPSVNDSVSTHQSMSDHARTPSHGSSTHETSSPSPPRTPEDAHSALLGIAAAHGEKSPHGDASVESALSYDTPMSMSAEDAYGGVSTATTATPAQATAMAAGGALAAAAGAATVAAMASDDTTPPASSSRQAAGAEQALAAPKPTKASASNLATPPQKSRSKSPAPKSESPQPPTSAPDALAMLTAGSKSKRGKKPKNEAPKPKEEPFVPKLKPYVDYDPWAPGKPPRVTEEPKEPEQLPPLKAPFKARNNSRTLVTRANYIHPDPTISLFDLTHELERSLENFRHPMQSGGPERSMIIRSELLVYVAEIDKRCYDPREEPQYRELREFCYDWADSLLFELRNEQPANERGACLEGLAAILECNALAAEALQLSISHQSAFRNLMVRVMNFVMDKLGAKGVFHNTLLFSGRFLAFAFFRIPHIGGQLVGVLQPPRGALMRFTRPVLIGQRIPPEAQPTYPEHLQGLCFDNAQAYTRRLLSLEPDFEMPDEKEAFHFQPGNWLRRWQSDDSELFPAFYRAYHRQLANYLAPAVEYYQQQNRPVPTHVLFRAPGYAHLATIFARKCHSYILGSVNAVTTSSSGQHFDATESAGFRGSQKPAVLETANRRLVETMWTFASTLVTLPTSDGRVLECDGSQLWGEMVELWMKNLITKTSLYSPKGVFCLFDLIDGIVDPVLNGSADSPLDIPYVIGLVRLILNEAEHALTLVKVIAFVFTHWEILTARPEDRKELCLDILLDRKLFERLCLFWSQSVRSYVLRLVVFRLGHLHTTSADGESYNVEIESVQLLQTRLDRIKRRHDELEPAPKDDDVLESPTQLKTPHTPRTPTTTQMPRSRSTITMVADSPQAPSKAEKLLGLGGFGQNDEDGGKPKASWWKRTLGKPGKKARKAKEAASPSISPSPTLTDVTLPSPRSSTSSRYENSAGSIKGRQSPAPSMSKPQPAPPAQSANGNGNGSLQSPSQSAPPPQAQPPAPEPKLEPSPMAADAGVESPRSSESSDSPNSRGRKGPPPNINVDHAKRPEGTKAAFAFEFDLPAMSPRSDAFDPAPNATSPRRSSQPPSPRATSPHMSQSFSKRSSLLPPSTEKALADVLKNAPPVPVIDLGYDKKLHCYAVRMLAELEDAQKEYDEWWSEGGIGKVDGAPLRLAVAWPFHEGED